MSEQEKKRVNKSESGAVVVEFPGARLPAPARADDAASASRHVRPPAPPAPDVEENLKVSEEPSDTVKERKASAVASVEKSIHDAVKKLSSTDNRLEMEAKRSSTSAPIPVDMKTLAPPSQPLEKAPSTATAEDIVLDDMQVRKVEVMRKHSDWSHPIEYQTSSSLIAKKKEISWNDAARYPIREPLKELGAGSRIWNLERKASVGPCKSRTLFAAPSGLMFCVPKKSSNCMRRSCIDFSGGINISFSGKDFSRKCKSGVHFEKSASLTKSEEEAKRAVKVDINIPYMKLFTTVRSKVDIVRSTIRSILDS